MVLILGQTNNYTLFKNITLLDWAVFGVATITLWLSWREDKRRQLKFLIECIEWDLNNTLHPTRQSIPLISPDKIIDSKLSIKDSLKYLQEAIEWERIEHQNNVIRQMSTQREDALIEKFEHVFRKLKELNNLQWKLLGLK
jgi:hypothetical protein